jgi:osmotically-inducible protein OsmY
MNKSESLTNEIEKALRNDERTRDAVIDVINEQGIVTLFGQVESNQVAEAAEDIVRRQQGVLFVTAWLFLSTKMPRRS